MTETKQGEARKTDLPPEQRQEGSGGDEIASAQEESRLHRMADKPLTIFYHWCKGCNICIAFCPQKVFVPDRDGKPIIQFPEKCTQCAFCWMHCPDLAIVSNKK